MKTKSVSYAYPSSVNAAILGFSRTGCYAVCRSFGDDVPEAIKGFATKAEAVAFAESMPEPMSWLSMTNPRFA